MDTIPSPAVVAGISRDDWENLCASIMSREKNVLRVSDRKGKGNGLDGWILCGDGVEGYQYRRWEESFTASQSDKIRKSIALARSRCPTEFGAKLVRYVVLANRDLEPGHLTSTGELERWRTLVDWALSEHAVALEFRGLSWVHERVLAHPDLAPSLFVDLAAEFGALRAMQAKMLQEFSQLREGEFRNPESARRFKKLVEEATRHFDRGVRLRQEQELRRALESLEDSRRLIEDEESQADLLADINTLLCGIRADVGNIELAIAEGRQAERHFASRPERQHDLLAARGNLATALTNLMRLSEARPLAQKAYEGFKRLGESSLSIQSLITLGSIAVQSADFQAMTSWLSTAKRDLDAFQITEKNTYDAILYLHAMGTRANVFLVVARDGPTATEEQGFLMALRDYEEVERTATEWGLKKEALTAKIQMAQALWFLRRYSEAETKFAEIEAMSNFGYDKLLADSHFNHACMLAEMGQDVSSRRPLLRKAEALYIRVGDTKSLHQTRKMLSESE